MANNKSSANGKKDVYACLVRVKYNGRTYEPGEKISMPSKDAEFLLAVQAIAETDSKSESSDGDNE